VSGLKTKSVVGETPELTPVRDKITTRVVYVQPTKSTEIQTVRGRGG